MPEPDDPAPWWMIGLALVIVLVLAGCLAFVIWDTHHRSRDRVDVTHMRVEVADYYRALVKIGYAQDKVDRHSVYFQSDHEADLRWWVTTCRMNARVYNGNVRARGRLSNAPVRLDPDACHA